MHLEDLADTFLLLAGGVEHGIAGLDGTGVHTHEHELAVERVGGDLEDQSRERIGLDRLAVDLDGLIARLVALDGRHVLRGRQVIDDAVQHRLNALVLEGGTAEDREGFLGDGELAHASADVFLGQVAVLEELVHELVVGFGSGFHELLVVFLGLVLEVVRDLGGVVLGAELLGAVPHVGLHLNQVDNAGEVVLGTDRQLHHDRSSAQLLLDGVDGVVEVRAELVHLVDEADTRNAVLVSLTPHGLGLRLHAFLAVEHGNGSIEHTQGALHLGREVHVARGIDDVDLELALGVVGLTAPEAGGSSRLDGDTTFLLLRHEVHGGGAVVGLADLVVLTGVEQNTLGSGGLAGIDVGHDADIADVVEVRNLFSHRFSLAFLGGLRLPAVVSEGLVGLSHLVGVLATLDGSAETVGGIEDLVGETLGHGLLTTGAGEIGQPAQRQGVGAVRLDLDRHLVGSATDTAGANLEGRTDVVQGALEHSHRLLVGLLLDHIERGVHDVLGDRLLAVKQNLVDELRHHGGTVDRIGQHDVLLGRSLT